MSAYVPHGNMTYSRFRFLYPFYTRVEPPSFPHQVLRRSCTFCNGKKGYSPAHCNKNKSKTDTHPSLRTIVTIRDIVISLHIALKEILHTLSRARTFKHFKSTTFRLSTLRKCLRDSSNNNSQKFPRHAITCKHPSEFRD